MTIIIIFHSLVVMKKQLKSYDERKYFSELGTMLHLQINKRSLVYIMYKITQIEDRDIYITWKEQGKWQLL